MFFSFLFFLQLLSAAVESDSQWSVGMSHVLPLVNRTSLENMLHGLVVSTTWAGCRRHQLCISIHGNIQSVVTCAQSYQGNLLLFGQQVVVIPAWSWHRECPDDVLPLAVADAVV